jgi:hypothetical protein
VLNAERFMIFYFKKYFWVPEVIQFDFSWLIYIIVKSIQPQHSVLSLIPTLGEVYSMQFYVIKFSIDLKV